MSNMGPDRRRGATERRVATNETVMVAAQAFTEREAVVFAAAQAVDRREEAGNDKTPHSAPSEVQLREANERLVVAAVHAQTMAEIAERATNQMAYMAEHDFLTGLPNRYLLTDRLAQAIALARRHGKKLALMFLDLDHFKYINDSLGHTVGDQLLQSVAKRLLACVRHSDTVSRQGGDEFVVLLPEVEAAQDATISAEKFIKAVAEPHLIGDHQLHVTLSIGISLYPDDGNDVETVVRNADIAMYYAKNKGRNSCQRFTPDLNTHAATRQAVETALRHALDQHEFVLHYQPQKNLETGAITGVEALVRLQQADHRLLDPLGFIGIAEDSGLILQIGKWVLREACRQAAAWLQAGFDIGRIAVNIAAQEFHHKDFLAGVRAILDDSGLDPHHLELELTESGLMQDTEQTMAIMHALNDLGVKIAVDDFGTGYSSLSYLRRFPIDTLKIDQSFVQDIDSGADEPIVSAIIAMGQSLKLRVVAEGIETPHQLTFLQSHRYIDGQGYYFGRPVAAKDFATLLTVDGR